MILKDIIANLENYDDEQTIFVMEYHADSEACVVKEEDDKIESISYNGKKYLLEVELAKDAIRVWTQWRDGRQPTLDEKLEAVLYYANNDSYLPNK